MTQTTAQQDAPTDAEIEALAKKYVARGADAMREAIPNSPPYRHTEQFKRIKAMVFEVLARYAPAQDAEQARDTAVRNAGSTLSNIAFNMAQQVGKVLNSDDVSMLDSARLAWDRALKSTSAGEGE